MEFTPSDGLVWEPPVLRTVATEDTGIAHLVAEIDKHREYLHKSGNWEKQARLRLMTQLEHLLKAELVSRSAQHGIGATRANGLDAAR